MKYIWTIFFVLVLIGLTNSVKVVINGNYMGEYASINNPSDSQTMTKDDGNLLKIDSVALNKFKEKDIISITDEVTTLKQNGRIIQVSNYLVKYYSENQTNLSHKDRHYLAHQYLIDRNSNMAGFNYFVDSKLLEPFVNYVVKQKRKTV